MVICKDFSLVAEKYLDCSPGYPKKFTDLGNIIQYTIYNILFFPHKVYPRNDYFLVDDAGA